MAKRTREAQPEQESPILVTDVVTVIFSQMVDDPIGLLKLLKCSKNMLSILEPMLTEMMTQLHSLITSRIENAGWDGVDFTQQPSFYLATKNFLENSYETNYRHIQTLASREVTNCRETTVFLLSLMKRAILEDAHLFISGPENKRNRFKLTGDTMHPDTRLKNIYWIQPDERTCVPILETNIMVAPDLERKKPNNYNELVDESIGIETCPIQRELLRSFHKHSKPTTVWEKMKTLFTLTSRIQKIRKPRKDDTISRVVIPSQSTKYIHIGPVISQYFLHLGTQEEADIALKLNHNRSFVLHHIAKVTEKFAKKPLVIDLTRGV